MDDVRLDEIRLSLYANELADSLGLAPEVMFSVKIVSAFNGIKITNLSISKSTCKNYIYKKN